MTIYRFYTIARMLSPVLVAAENANCSEYSLISSPDRLVGLATDASDCPSLEMALPGLERPLAPSLPLPEVRGLGPSLCTTGRVSRRGFYSTAYSTYISPRPFHQIYYTLILQDTYLRTYP